MLCFKCWELRFSSTATTSDSEHGNSITRIDSSKCTSICNATYANMCGNICTVVNMFTQYTLCDVNRLCIE